ncbi:hypothetical protein JIN77_05505 [Verrucomicrobiaceae bacterium R5-34]|nr:hypothetical protein [Verrucomicrobiaceae bacterium R5-34]
MNESPTLTTIVDDYGDLCFPILIRGSKIIVFRISEDDTAHTFGGELSSNIRIPLNAVIHNLATLDTTSCEGLADVEAKQLHLIYAFRHDGDGVNYKVKGESIEVTSISPDQPDEDWPYEDYPDVFPRRFLEVWGIIDADQDAIDGLLHQEVDMSGSDLLIAVFPPSESYGVSLWGEYGDPEMVQCIFEYNLKKGEVNTYNLCG